MQRNFKGYLIQNRLQHISAIKKETATKHQQKQLKQENKGGNHKQRKKESFNDGHVRRILGAIANHLLE